MKPAWLGLALLSASWLFGLSYYEPANMHYFAAITAAGSLLLIASADRIPGRGQSFLAMLMVLPVAWFMPWPYRGSCLVLLAGLAMVLMPATRSVRRAMGGGFILAGAVLTAQMLAMLGYETQTARSHELPTVLRDLLAAVASLAGIDAGASQNDIALGTMRKVHMLGATWELFLDPASLCLLVGGIVLLTFRTVSFRIGTRWRSWYRAVGALFIILAVWLPVRAGLLMAIMIHRALRTEYDEALGLTNLLWSPWVHLLLLIPPVLMAWRFIRPPSSIGQAVFPPVEITPVPVAPWYRKIGAVVAAFLALAALTAAAVWDPVGQRKAGRVLVDEYHSDWERTDKPYDTEWYGHDAGYNYACIYDYLTRYYDASRLNAPITDEVLRNCDVLVLKTPTKMYAPKEHPDELAIIRRFVERGGGVLLIGEHTNVFGIGKSLNQIAEIFGFRYRYDCLFGIDTPFDQLFLRPMVPHPVVQNVASMDFAVSCSIDPGTSNGRAVIRSTGLKNMTADYHASNFYPQVEDRADVRYGAFVQLWSVRHGGGRVLAFTDSTIFSNFATFEPGKAELMLGMIEWLNHRNVGPDPRDSLIWIGVLMALAAVVLARHWQGGWVVLIGAGLLGWLLTGLAVRELQRRQMPPVKNIRPFVQVMMDRTVCDGPLSKGGFIRGEPDGFAILERWFLRLGYFTRREAGPAVLQGNLVVMPYPRRAVSARFCKLVSDYVNAGGKLLVLDSPENTGSTANNLIEPFGMKIERDTNEQGPLVPPPSWPTGVLIEAACKVSGGDPFMTVNGRPVAAQKRYGQGTVTVIGFGSKFSDLKMGVTGDVRPEAALRKIFDLDFALMRWIVEGRITTQPATATASMPAQP